MEYKSEENKWIKKVSPELIQEYITVLELKSEIEKEILKNLTKEEKIDFYKEVNK